MTKRCESDSIFIAGSNGYLLSGELSTDLTGRHIEFGIGTLTFDGYLGMKEYFRLPVEKSIFLPNSGNTSTKVGFPAPSCSIAPGRMNRYPRNHQGNLREGYPQEQEDPQQGTIRCDPDRYHRQFWFEDVDRLACEYPSKTRKEPIEKETVFRYLGIVEKAKTISKCERF